ncbi:hypothetical protein IMZ31_22435 (plasmid) [Pontibacillus sp. ALD_SL1]|uniref:NUMOD4 domain-containing protein n=1 Tax=Pontibacillus sp. ALD_SL1 TaxID=2777185 RepID=UPI001A95F9A9|nr:NUMOD4 domain-containing protein [Pontibacillus sp. ALD_SL1]QST02214.1 hypothetical protein IMZ31_22435 [Pontibacillus sp. ALD_SL1]
MKTIKVYEPKSNRVFSTTYKHLSLLTGIPVATLSNYKSREQKVPEVGYYILKEDTSIETKRLWYAREHFPKEIWVSVKGTEGAYMISNHGRFKRVMKKGEKFLLPYCKKTSGYMCVKVPYNGVYKEHKVCNLVGIHFLGGPYKGYVLRHKNGIKTEDNVFNLHYITIQESNRLNGAKTKALPVVCYDAETFSVRGEYRSVKEAGVNEYVSRQTVLDNCYRKTNREGEHQFRFACTL